MYQMTAKQKREIKKLVDKHVQGAIRDYGVPPECYGVTADADDDLIISTPPSGGVGVDIDIVPGAWRWLFANMDYDKALTEPGYYHDGEDKLFICNPIRYSTVRTEFQLFINAMWIVPDKRIFTYLYITSQPKRLTHQKG